MFIKASDLANSDFIAIELCNGGGCSAAERCEKEEETSERQKVIGEKQRESESELMNEWMNE